MPDTPSSPNRSGGEGWALGIGAVAMIGCCGAPLLIALASSAAIGTLLGVGGGILTAIALGAIAITTTRRRRACVTLAHRQASRAVDRRSPPPAINPNVTPRSGHATESRAKAPPAGTSGRPAGPPHP